MPPTMSTPALAHDDAASVMRADLLPDEYRSLCLQSGTVEVHQVVCINGVLGGRCSACGWVEPAAAREAAGE